MIKGNFNERIKNEDYIRSLKDKVIPELEPFDRCRRVYRRYYETKAVREKRSLDVAEVRVVNLMTLLGCAIKIAGVVYTWLQTEFIPGKLMANAWCEVEWNVSDEELANLLMAIPDKSVEAALIKADAPRATISNILSEKQVEDKEAIRSEVAQIPLEKLFGSYKLLISFIQLTGMGLSSKNIDVKDFYNRFQ